MSIDETYCVGILISRLFSCSDNLHELGIEDGHIPDQAMTASSILDGNHGPGRGRLNQGPTGSQGTAWCAKEEDEDQYLQVDLSKWLSCSYFVQFVN